QIYESITPGDIFGKIAKMKFSAMVCFTQDTFLVKAFEENNIPYSFEYYSVKGTNPVPPVPKEIPFIYNLYGKYDDTNSLITDYTTFYAFLFSIMGNNNFFSANLINKLSDAKVLVFLGFDLKEWYVPLLVTKIYNSGPPSRNEMLTVASLNDTEDNAAYLQWIKKYPLNLSLIPESEDLIKRLYAIEAFQRPIPIPHPDPNPNPIDPVEKDKWIKMMGNIADVEELLQLYSDIIDYSKDKYPIYATFFTTTRSSMVMSQKDLMEEAISYDSFHSEMVRNIRKSIMQLST
ncbi:MAG: SIR2 family protein, partial [Ginsengibacter sp.]